MDLSLPVAVLPGVGPASAKKLEKIDIHTIHDLLYAIPFRYTDLSATSGIATLNPGEVVTLTGKVVEIKNVYTRQGKNLQKATFADDTGSLSITWFNQPYLVRTLSNNPYISLSGKVVSYKNRLSLTSPQYELITEPTYPQAENPQTIHTGRLVPEYHLTQHLSGKWLRSLLAKLLKPLSLPDPLDEIAGSCQHLPLAKALQTVHFPESIDLAYKARQRLAFEELFYLQLAALWRKRDWQQKELAHPLKVDTAFVTSYLTSLPFPLTGDQETALKEILHDLERNQPMNRLLQGDVGSGKTVLAAIAMAVCAANNLPAVLMAPTEILALQHAQTLQKLYSPLHLTISVQTKSRHDPLEKALIIVGTHAVLHRSLPSNVGLLIIDEQHRFGVKQRLQLLQRPKLPHVLSMTATPIPRTIALSLYAELDLSVIKEMPKNRLRVKTWVVPEEKRPNAYAWIKGEIKSKGTQAFVICPFIQSSENPQLEEVKAVTKEFERLSSELSSLKVRMIHGQMTSKEKDNLMNSFLHREFEVLLATPVIEVGIDIRNATIIVIESAERFGLAQLHQLRGRVGRGDQQSYCLLFTSNNSDNNRLSHVEHTHSGFALAELDLKLRGPGELFGLRQSGYKDLTFASWSDSHLIHQTRQAAQHLLDQDPSLSRHSAILATLKTVLAKQTTPH